MSTYNPNNAPGFGQQGPYGPQGGQFGGQQGQPGQFGRPGQGGPQGGQYGPQGGQYGPQGGQYGGGGGYPPGGAPYGPQGGGYGGGMPPRQSQTKVSTLLIVGIIGALLIGVVGWLVLGRGGGDTPPPPGPPSTSTAPPTTTTSPPPTSPSPGGDTTSPGGDTTSPGGDTTTTPPAPSGNDVDLGQGVVVSLPSGWTVEDSEPGVAVVGNGMSYVTLQVFRPSSPVDAMGIMTGYIEQMKQSFQNPQVNGPEAINVGSNGTGAVMVITGTRVTSSGSFSAVLGSTIITRSSDSVSMLATILTVPEGWDPSIDDYNVMVNDMAGDLLG